MFSPHGIRSVQKISTIKCWLWIISSLVCLLYWRFIGWLLAFCCQILSIWRATFDGLRFSVHPFFFPPHRLVVKLYIRSCRDNYLITSLVQPHSNARTPQNSDIKAQQRSRDDVQTSLLSSCLRLQHTNWLPHCHWCTQPEEMRHICCVVISTLGLLTALTLALCS